MTTFILARSLFFCVNHLIVIQIQSCICIKTEYCVYTSPTIRVRLLRSYQATSYEAFYYLYEYRYILLAWTCLLGRSTRIFVQLLITWMFQTSSDRSIRLVQKSNPRLLAHFFGTICIMYKRSILSLLIANFE